MDEEYETYKYCWEQCKSMRQGLTVQGIDNTLSAAVYAAHARIALEASDLEEFN